MKKIIIRSLICVCVTYMILSMILSIYYLINVNQNIKDIPLNKNSEIHQEEIYISNNMTVGNLIDLSNYSGKLDIIYSNLINIIISVVLGLIISLTTFLKEESKSKFILIFILGYIIINLFFSLFTVYIFLNNGIEISFSEKYIDSIKYTFIPYCIIFFIISLVQKFVFRKKVNELNKIIKR